MSELTPRLGIKKPVGNETVSRAAYNENWDIIDSNVATKSELDTHIGAGGDIHAEATALLAGFMSAADKAALNSHIGSGGNTHAVATTSAAGFMSAVDKARLDAIVFPPGLIANFARSTPPTGWLECNGQTVSRTTYADLFAAIGTTFGTGDGSTTFNIPDHRDRSSIAKGTTFSNLGAKGGAATHTLTINEMPSHNHTFTTESVTTGSNVGSARAYFTFEHNLAQPITATFANTGGGAAHNNMHPYIVTLVCIKY